MPPEPSREQLDDIFDYITRRSNKTPSRWHKLCIGYILYTDDIEAAIAVVNANG